MWCESKTLCVNCLISVIRVINLLLPTIGKWLLIGVNVTLNIILINYVYVHNNLIALY